MGRLSRQRVTSYVPRLGLGCSIFRELLAEIHQVSHGPPGEDSVPRPDGDVLGRHLRSRDTFVLTHLGPDEICHPSIYLNPFPFDVFNFRIIRNNMLRVDYLLGKAIQQNESFVIIV